MHRKANVNMYKGNETNVDKKNTTNFNNCIKKMAEVVPKAYPTQITKGNYSTRAKRSGLQDWILHTTVIHSVYVYWMDQVTVLFDVITCQIILFLLGAWWCFKIAIKLLYNGLYNYPSVLLCWMSRVTILSSIKVCIQKCYTLSPRLFFKATEIISRFSGTCFQLMM